METWAPAYSPLCHLEVYSPGLLNLSDDSTLVNILTAKRWELLTSAARQGHSQISDPQNMRDFVSLLL